MNHNPMEQAHEETEKIFRTLLPQKLSAESLPLPPVSEKSPQRRVCRPDLQPQLPAGRRHPPAAGTAAPAP